MPTKSEKTTAPAVDYSTMNAYQKLQIARSKFLQAGVKKTGKNIHLEFMYFELQDIVPVAVAIFSEVGLLMVPTFGRDYAVARVYNVDDPDENPIAFEAPFTQIAPIVSNTVRSSPMRCKPWVVLSPICAGTCGSLSWTLSSPTALTTLPVPMMLPIVLPPLLLPSLPKRPL